MHNLSIVFSLITHNNHESNKAPRHQSSGAVIMHCLLYLGNCRIGISLKYHAL